MTTSYERFAAMYSSPSAERETSDLRDNQQLRVTDLYPSSGGGFHPLLAQHLNKTIYQGPLMARRSKQSNSIYLHRMSRETWREKLSVNQARQIQAQSNLIEEQRQTIEVLVSALNNTADNAELRQFWNDSRLLSQISPFPEALVVEPNQQRESLLCERSGIVVDAAQEILQVISPVTENEHKCDNNGITGEENIKSATPSQPLQEVRCDIQQADVPQAATLQATSQADGQPEQETAQNDAASHHEKSVPIPSTEQLHQSPTAPIPCERQNQVQIQTPIQLLQKYAPKIFENKKFCQNTLPVIERGDEVVCLAIKSGKVVSKTRDFDILGNRVSVQKDFREAVVFIFSGLQGLRSVSVQTQCNMLVIAGGGCRYVDLKGNTLLVIVDVSGCFVHKLRKECGTVCGVVQHLVQ